MSVMGNYDFDVLVSGIDSRGMAGTERHKVRAEQATLAKEGALGLVRTEHPTWTDLMVESCVEV